MKIIHDPLNIINKNNDSFDINVFKEQGEDIAQVQKENGLTYDLGYYKNKFKIYVVENENWDKPIDVIESNDLIKIITKFRTLIDY